MTIRHEWNVPPAEAIALQREFAALVETEDRLGEVHCVAGVDMALNPEENMARAAVVLLSFPDLALLEEHIYIEPLRMPYIPGLLSFRELPSLLGALAKLSQPADLIMADGQGIAHPRRLGIASHLGLWLDVPTIGCAKSILVGKHDEVAQEVGSWAPLIDKGETVGAALRTRKGVKPMYISPGHRISLATSIRYVLACGGGLRLPETTRQADKLSKFPPE